MADRAKASSARRVTWRRADPGEPATFASDVFSLGTVLYELTTGKTAFAAPHVLQVMEQIRSLDPRPMAGRDPRAVPFLIHPMLAPDPRTARSRCGRSSTRSTPSASRCDRTRSKASLERVRDLDWGRGYKVFLGGLARLCGLSGLGLCPSRAFTRMSWRTARESVRSDWLRLLGLLVAVTCLFAVADTVADPDLWGHLRFGRDILRSGHATQRDRYSYLSDRPWINHEWLAEVMFASVYQAGGPRPSSSSRLRWGRWYSPRDTYPSAGRSIPSADRSSCLPWPWPPSGAGECPSPDLHLPDVPDPVARPAEGSSGRAAGTLWLAVPVFMAWANLHGGFLAGLAVILIWGFFMSWEILRAERRGAAANRRGS